MTIVQAAEIFVAVSANEHTLWKSNHLFECLIGDSATSRMPSLSGRSARLMGYHFTCWRMRTAVAYHSTPALLSRHCLDVCSVPTDPDLPDERYAFAHDRCISAHGSRCLSDASQTVPDAVCNPTSVGLPSPICRMSFDSNRTAYCHRLEIPTNYSPVTRCPSQALPCRGIVGLYGGATSK
jgi:hypothetical protein